MKKIVLVGLTVILLFSLTACGSNLNSSSQNSTSQSTTGQSAAGGAGQHSDSGYNLDTLISAVKKAGVISGEPQNLDVKDNGAQKAVAYGNIVFLEFDPSSSNAYFSAYDAGTVKINGKNIKIGAINGPYMMVFLDGNIDQRAVQAFRSVGYSH